MPQPGTQKILLTFDGGSRGNPGPAYGSFLIQGKGFPTRPPVRLHFGHATNNEAEYRTLIAGLEWLREKLPARDLSPSEIQLTLRGDSTLVLKQVSGEWKAKNPRMRELRDEVQRLVADYKTVRLDQQDRWRIVEVLGH